MVESIDFGVVFEEGKEFNSNNTIDEERNENYEKNVESFGENGEDGFEDFFGKWNLIKNYVKGKNYVSCSEGP